MEYPEELYKLLL